MVPLDLFVPDVEATRRFKKWAREAIESEGERDDLSEKVSEIQQKFATFNLPFMSLPVTTRPETALDVFVKMNTSAAALSIYDIVVAQVEAGLGKSLHDLVAEIRRTCPSVDEYYPPQELCLYAGALLQQRAPTNANYMSKDFGKQMVADWENLVKGIKRAVTFLEEERIFDAKRLPTDVAIPVLTALWAVAPEALDGAGRARTILRKYLWRAFFSGRYEKATNSKALSDFQELKPLVTGSRKSTPEIFDVTKYPLPEAQELMTASWPVSKDRLARAILALALRQGGLDLADGGTVSRENLKRREYHHLFPDAYLVRKGEPTNRIYLSLNCALVTWQTNRNISDKEPERYLAERADKSTLGAADAGASKRIVAERLISHLIPFKEMISGDYQAFLVARASMVHEAMISLCQADSA
jgi:hypothetical protein